MDLVKIKQLIREGKLIKFYQSPGWYGSGGLRQQALERDNYECQECKRQGRVTTTLPDPAPGTPSLPGDGNKKQKENSLQVHHKKEVKDFPELALVLDNLETLCITCHNEHHDRLKEFNTKKPKFTNEERW